MLKQSLAAAVLAMLAAACLTAVAGAVEIVPSDSIPSSASDEAAKDTKDSNGRKAEAAAAPAQPREPSIEISVVSAAAADGSFEIPHVLPGSYQFFVSAPGVDNYAGGTSFDVEDESPGEVPAPLDLGKIPMKAAAAGKSANAGK